MRWETIDRLSTFRLKNLSCGDEKSRPAVAVRPRFATFLTALVLTALGTATLAIACDTPVYRYAMYRWLPAPYEVYLFHDGTIDESGQAVQQALQQYGEREGAAANVVFLPVNLAEDPELNTVPPDVKKAWDDRPEKKTPAYLMASPVGMQVPVSDLTADQIEAMVDSPLRQQLGKQLESGAAGVFVLLTGKDEEANKKARAAIQKVVEDVNSGEVSLYQAPPAMFGAPVEEPGTDDAGPPATQVAMLEVARDDPQEAWVRKYLLALEPDLPARTEPMVFTVYGRGRAVFSCLGEGIVADNLVMDVEFITGACSCTVKEQNPGVDLLMAYDWEAAAASIAEKFGAEEGNQYQFGSDELFPELIIPASEPGDEQPDSASMPVGASAAEANQDATTSLEADTKGTANSATSEEALDSPEAPATTQGQPANGTAEQQLASAVESAAGARPESGGEVESHGDDSHAGGQPRISGVMLVGIGLGVAFLVFLGATFVVLRP